MRKVRSAYSERDVGKPGSEVTKHGSEVRIPGTEVSRPEK